MEGYAKIANLMTEDPGLAIFRRFGAMNMQNLLYLQAELVQLEDELKEQSQLDHSNAQDTFRYSFSSSWIAMKLSAKEEGSGQQWEKVCEIQEKLHKYYQHLFYSTAISKANPPNGHNLKFFREWFERSDMGNQPLLDDDKFVWNGEYDKDLIALGQPAGEDVVSRWFIDNMIPLLHRKFKRSVSQPDLEAAGSPYSSYSDRRLLRYINILSTVISSLFPVLAMVVLSFVHNTQGQLCVIAAFTSIFAFCLASITEGRRIEIFAATSTFAAVLVVFLGTGTIY